MTGRQTFYEARRRERQAARAWLASFATVVFALVFVVGVLLAPPLYVLIGLSLDLLDRAVGAPDLLGTLAEIFERLSNGDAPPPLRIAGLLVLAGVPGFALLLLGWWRLGRLGGAHAASLARSLGLRDARTGDIEEQQFGNVVAEMAIAAGCAAPRVQMLDSDAVNIGLFGEGSAAVLFATRGALEHLTRDQTQALAGQVVASLVDGDGRLADRGVRLFELLGLVVLVAQAPLSVAARRALRPLFAWRAPGDAAVEAVRAALADPMEFLTRHDQAAGRDGEAKPGWREFLLLPLMGSALVGVVIVPITTSFLLGPLLGLLWRRRRLLADATAVQLTRNPQALADAYLACMGQHTLISANTPWLVHLFALEATPAPMLRLLSPYPSWRTRIARLVAQGAIAELPAKPPPRVRWTVAAFVLAPLLTVAGVLMVVVVGLSIWLTVALNMLFLALPATLLHALLRA